MEQKVCLDTDVVIAILNNEERAISILDKIKNDTILITVITLFELLLRKTNLEAVEQFRNKVYILDLDEESARNASIIFKDLQKKGKIIDIRDIFIASICRTNKCSLATFNRKHFDSVKDLLII